MKQLIPTILENFPLWNEKVHDEADSDVYCVRRKIVKIETDLIDDLGEFRIYKEKPFIFINKFVEYNSRAWVNFHECGHELFHTPFACKFSRSSRSKMEKEANFVAAVALIPFYLIKTRHWWQIQEEFGYPKDLIMFRKYIWDTYKI